MKTVFHPNRQPLPEVAYVRVYEHMRTGTLSYCVHFSREERYSYENSNRHHHRPMYRLNVRATQ